MAAHVRSSKVRERGFYASLNKVSTADMLPVARGRKIKGRGRLWKVERLIAKKTSGTVS